MAYWWKPAIVSMPSMSMAVNKQGGFVRVEMGQISFALDAFDGAPPAKANISLDWGLDSTRATHIFDGNIYRRSWTAEQISYDLYEPEYDAKLLDDGLDEQTTFQISSCSSFADGAKTQITTSTANGFSAGKEIHIQGSTSYNGTVAVDSIISTTQFIIAVAFVADETGECSGNIVSRPLVIGTVTHMSPQRTGQDIEEKYYLPDFACYDCYDDGVPINDNWSDNGDGTLSRSVAIVGELTISGTGNMTTLADVFTWAAARMGLTLRNLHGGDVPVNHVAYGNELLCDFLDRLAWYCGYMYWILDDVLYLADREHDNGSQDIRRFDFIDIEYDWDMPIKSYSATWSVKRFDGDIVALVTDEKTVSVYTANSVGDEVTVNVFDETEDEVKLKMTAIAERDAKPLMKMVLPLDRLPAPGERLGFTDTRKAGVTLTGYLRVSRYSINYKSRTLDVEGPGAYTVSS